MKPLGFGYPKIEICSPDSKAMYITIDGYVFYIDNTTNEQIMECWEDDGMDGRYGKRVLVKENE
mgnify:CR=1 FL=1